MWLGGALARQAFTESNGSHLGPSGHGFSADCPMHSPGILLVFRICRFLTIGQRS
jgi:hypothetical protein